MELIEQLGIDGKVLLAQIVNFFLLLIILYKLLYRPILDVLEKRKNKIEKSLKEAQAIEERVQKVDEELKEKVNLSKKEALAIIEKAKVEEEEHRLREKEKTKEEITALQEKAKKEITDQKEALLKEAEVEITGLVVELTQKILKKNLTEEEQKTIQQEALDSIKKES